MIYLIIIVGIIIRLIYINQSLWLDEATTALATRMPIVDFFTKFIPGDFHPPLYYIIVRLWATLFGSTEVSLRIPSVIFGVLTIFIVYRIAKNYYAPLLVATSGLMIYYSQEARMYGLTACLVAWSIYLHVNKKWQWFSLAILLIGMTDYMGLFILPVFWLLTARKDLKKLIISHIPITVFYLLWLPIFVSQLRLGVGVEGSNWWKMLGVTNFKNIALIPVKFVLGRVSFENKYLYAFIVGAALTLYVYAGFMAIRRNNIWQKNSNSNFWRLIIGWLVTPVIIGIAIGFKIPTLTYFRFLYCLPALYILIAEGILRSGKVKYLLFSILILINILSASYYLFNPRFHREDWRHLAESVGESTIILPSNSQQEALIYYGKGSQVVYFKNFDGEPNEIWLSRYVWEVFDPENKAQQKIEKLGYNKVLEANFNGVVFWKYSKYENRN